MQHREEWEGLDEADGWALLRQAIAGKPVDWAAISDVLWWAERRDEEEGLGLMERFLDYLRHHLRSHEAKGGGWYAGQRKTWALGGTEFVMRWIPAGRFLMGAGEDDEEAWDDEKPQRDVKITRGFWMGETPVAQAQYQSIMGQNPSYQLKRDAPVERVSWFDAAAFTNRLSALEDVSVCFEEDQGAVVWGVGDDGRDYLRCAGWRLPTEAEWEYACRAGAISPRYGNLDDIAWYAENSADTTHPVGQKEPNAWGLHDMLGNVWEWVYDTHRSYRGFFWVRDPVHVDDVFDFQPVCRGGSFHLESRVRAAARDWHLPSLRSGDLGFRIVRGVAI